MGKILVTVITAIISFSFMLSVSAAAEKTEIRDAIKKEIQILNELREKEKQIESAEQEKKRKVIESIESPKAPEIQWRFFKMPLDVFFNTLADQGIVVETRNIPATIKTVTVNWKGYDIRDGLKAVFPSCNVEFEGGRYVIDCMITRKIRLPFTYSVSNLNVSAAVEGSTQSGVTAGNTSTSAFGGASATSGSRSGGGADYVMTRNFDYYKTVETESKKLLSKEGTISVSQAGGFVVVRDFPQNVEAVEKFILSELSSTDQVKFQVKLVKVSLKRGHEYGIDWNHVLSNFATKNLTLSITSAGNVSNPVLSLGGGKQNWDFLVKAVSEYGDMSVLHSWDVVAKGGETVILKHVTDIPFISDVQTSQSSVSTITTPSFSSQEVGLKIIFDFTKNRDEININGIIDVSSVVEFKQFSVSGFNIERPSIMKDFVRFQSKAYLGESLLVSGFKVNTEDSNSRSIPGVSKIPVIGWLFGYDKEVKEKNEYLVIITPEGVL